MRRRLALLVPLALPWSVQVYVAGDATLLFPWALVTPAPLHATFLWEFLLRYTAGLPGWVLMWPASVLAYLLGLASAALARVGREDPRVTAGLLALAGVAQLWVAVGFAWQAGRYAVPTGTVVLWLVAGWDWKSTR